MLTNHPRYREIPLETTQELIPQVGNALRIVLFHRDESLRSHAVSHMTNLSETAWFHILSAKRALITESITRLQELGCPYYTLGLEKPPCQTGACRLYETCETAAKELEDAYLEILENILLEGTRIPRFALYFYDKEKIHLFCLMPDRPFVLYASLLPDGIFNLMTGYAGRGVSFSEMREDQVELIKNNARNRNITWCNTDTWQVQIKDENQNPGDIEKGQNRKTKKKLKPYKRESGKNWREYLDEYV